MSIVSRAFESPALIFTAALILRLVLFYYGIYQDAHSALKYTDIDYFVFTDAARAVSRGLSPYARATYRYTPLLAWILLPTSWSGKDGLWFHSGKALFAVSDIVAGWLIYRLLQKQGMEKANALKYASVWLLNPMVANISTRGSSEGLLCVLVMATLYAFETRRINLAGALLGLSVHFKIYPFIYGVSMFWALKSKPASAPNFTDFGSITTLINKGRIQLVASSLAVFTALNLLMYSRYGQPFLEHTFLYHFTRTDHRHNFSLYNALLYFSSADASAQPSILSAERLAFLPQLSLSCILLSLLPSTSYSLATTMLAQTLAFVTFNKVCTSQYFLWYLIFLPLYLPHSSLMQNGKLSAYALSAWVAGQAAWLGFGFQLEFLGRSAWLGLWASSALFFLINCWLLGIVVQDGGKLVRAKLEGSSADMKGDQEQKRIAR
ncbi:GPI mannosyltransferase 1 [Knufia obscura]|uniref:GPI mannosyltransferase 1 n=2 Tax=Knufia TaxID=430999 RepID=A0AAN8E981_9EURO|nr:GPI mannosyltransferase 1 [Knufia obscura]KAK5948190.1 GPI mannosyltransferase 1 [Knufia fluminis]